MTTLVLSSRQSEDNQKLWRTAIRRGWSVERAQGIRLPNLDDAEIVFYMESLFAHSVASRLQRTLLEPPVDWLCKLPVEFTQRQIGLTTLGEMRSVIKPVFVKPPNEKSFPAKVFPSGSELPEGFTNDTLVLTAEPVQWEGEFRCFCLNGRALTLSPYSRSGIHAAETDYRLTLEEQESVIGFTEQVLSLDELNTPAAIVIDVGIITGKGMAVVEANGAWGSGIYGCNPDRVLDVIRCATVPCD